MLKQNKLEFPWKQPGILKEREDKSKHENAFIYFLVPFHLCPSKPQAGLLMNAFKPQRELRRTIFDRSEEGTKYSSPVREMHSIIFVSRSEQSLHLPIMFSVLPLYSKFSYYFNEKKSCPLLEVTYFQINIVYISYDFRLPNTLEFLKCSHKINSFNQYNLRGTQSTMLGTINWHFTRVEGFKVTMLVSKGFGQLFGSQIHCFSNYKYNWPAWPMQTLVMLFSPLC